MTEILVLAFREREGQKEKTMMELFASRELSDDSPRTANPRPTDISLEISDEQFQQILDLMVKKTGKPLEKCTPLERAEALFEVIRVGGSYGISYEFSEEKTRKPFTAQEVLENKKGDCDELSRLFIAVENKLAEYGKKSDTDMSLGDTKQMIGDEEFVSLLETVWNEAKEKGFSSENLKELERVIADTPK
ncbi:MAG: hypothetical protein QXD51_02665 [Candidatus Anstonellales archaeon]